MTLSQGQIVWVQYPFSDDPDKYKYRPALLISGSKTHQMDNDVILLPITSSLKNDDFSFLLYEERLKQGPLPKSSEVRCHKPATVRSTLIVDTFNGVREEALTGIKQKVEKALALGAESDATQYYQ
jgi:mRNA-degrading endonuclease toxin of MazEF toxin-antitoxin module